MCYPLQSYVRQSKTHRYTRIKPDYSAVGNLSEPIDDNLICVFVNQSHPQKNGTRAMAWTWKCVEWANRQCCFKLFKCCAQRQTNLTGFCSLIRRVCRADDAKTHTQTCLCEHATPVTSLYWQLLSTVTKQYRAAQEIRRGSIQEKCVCVCMWVFGSKWSSNGRTCALLFILRTCGHYTPLPLFI